MEPEPLPDHIPRNVQSVADIERREWEATSASQRRFERISRLVARPGYLLGILVFVLAWIVLNLTASRSGNRPLDPPPYEWLEGLLTLISLLTATVVLIAQVRQTKLEQQRSHLTLQINLLIEQKVTKLIDLVEELRRDLPMVRDRQDDQADALRKGADTAQLVSAMEGSGLTSNPETQSNSEEPRRTAESQ